MPREIVHWSILEGAREKLSSLDAVARLLDEHRAMAYLGAVAHDAPYYYRFGGDPFEHVAELLHGSEGNDTFIPLRVLASAISRDEMPAERAPLWSFLLGLVSHAVTDWVFHPLVYYFTGDYNDGQKEQRRLARLRHRLLETYLEAIFVSRREFLEQGRILRLMKRTGDALQPMSSLLDSILTAEAFPYFEDGTSEAVELGARMKVDAANGRWYDALRYLGYLQAAFLSPSASRGARLLAHIAPGQVAQYEVLFNGLRRAPYPRLEQPLRYQNPVTGEEYTVSVFDLAAEATEECAALFRRFEPLVSGEVRRAEEILGGLKGKSLSFGLPGVSTTEAKYFSAYGLELPGLERE
ncbi:MAG: zinc dependent phospholipase C family protein [Bdellovibrionales bacterium]|nr:zinc dependent phospholipase C family protein [Bdellovibrionales bacterium]